VVSYTAGTYTVPFNWVLICVRNNDNGGRVYFNNGIVLGPGESMNGIVQDNANTINTLVRRDSSGNFSAGTITATLSGNASSATQTTNVVAGGSVTTGEITLTGELNFTPAGPKYVDFFTDNDAGVLSAVSLRLVNNANTTFHTGIFMQRGGEVALYNNNVERFRTTATGVSITGTLNGYGIAGSVGDRFTKIPAIGSDGVMEIGRYIDFHSTAADGNDNTYRIDNDANGNLNFSGSINVGSTRFRSTILDNTNSPGTNGFALVSTGTGVEWRNPSAADASGISASAIASALNTFRYTYSSLSVPSSGQITFTDNGGDPRNDFADIQLIRIHNLDFYNTNYRNVFATWDDFTNPDADFNIVNWINPSEDSPYGYLTIIDYNNASSDYFVVRINSVSLANVNYVQFAVTFLAARLEDIDDIFPDAGGPVSVTFQRNYGPFNPRSINGTPYSNGYGGRWLRTTTPTGGNNGDIWYQY